MELPESYKIFLLNYSKIGYDNPEISFQIVSFGFYELILNDFIKILADDNSEIMVRQINRTENKFYNLLLRPFQGKVMSLNKYIFRVGVYGNHIANAYSRYSIKKVLIAELEKLDILKRKKLLFINRYRIDEKVKNGLRNFQYEDAKRNLADKVKIKVGLDNNYYEIFNNIVEKELNSIINPYGLGVSMLGK